MKLRLGKWRQPKRNPYQVEAHRRAWRLGVEAKRHGFIMAGNPYLKTDWPVRVRGAWKFPQARSLEWAAWRRGFLEAGGYCPFLRRSKR